LALRVQATPDRTIRSQQSQESSQQQRLIDSVSTVTELLRANTELRDQCERQAREITDKDGENNLLQIENS
jgi:hypothetical protein